MTHHFFRRDSRAELLRDKRCFHYRQRPADVHRRRQRFDAGIPRRRAIPQVRRQRVNRWRQTSPVQTDHLHQKTVGRRNKSFE